MIDIVKAMVIKAQRETEQEDFSLDLIKDQITMTKREIGTNIEVGSVTLSDVVELEIRFSYFIEGDLKISIAVNNNKVDLDDLQKVKLFIDTCIDIYNQ